MREAIKQVSIIGALLVIIAIIILGLGGTPSWAKGTAISGNTVADPLPSTGGKFQEVTLSFKNYAYELEPSTMVKGVPVRLNVDMSTVYGCMRDVVIPAFGVRQYVKEGDNVIEFTPDKSGKFNIMCSMNMGRGSFSVAEPSGDVADYTEKAPTDALPGASCGGEAGCGCGGAPA